MPVIHFTESDKMAAKILAKGIYTANLSSISNPSPSKSGASITYESEFLIASGPYTNKTLEVFFNSGTNQNSMLGTRQYAPSRELLKVAAAVLGVPLEQIPVDLDTDTLIGRTLDISVDVVTSEGNLLNIINGYYPVGKASAAPF